MAPRQRLLPTSVPQPRGPIRSIRSNSTSAFAPDGSDFGRQYETVPPVLLRESTAKSPGRNTPPHRHSAANPLHRQTTPTVHLLREMGQARIVLSPRPSALP